MSDEPERPQDEDGDVAHVPIRKVPDGIAYGARTSAQKAGVKGKGAKARYGNKEAAHTRKFGPW